MKIISKFYNFIEFSIKFKLPKMVKHKTDEELLDLYYKFSPEYYKFVSLHNLIFGAITVYVVGEELKKRHPNIHQLQNWNYSEPINLHEIIRR